MQNGEEEIVEMLEDIDRDIKFKNEPLSSAPKDFRAKHCKTVQELELFNFSSNYQTYLGGMSDLQTETGIDVGAEGLIAMSILN